jgi:hypothetical protein
MINTATVAAIIFTNHRGIIDWADANAARLLNVSPNYCAGRDLLAAFAQDRLEVLRAVVAAVSGDVVRGEGFIRPRERRPCPVTFKLVMDTGDHRFFQWTFEVAESAMTPLPRRLRLVRNTQYSIRRYLINPALLAWWR